MKFLLVIICLFGAFTTAALACPDIRLNGTQLSYSASQLYNAKAFNVVAGGDRYLPNCGIRTGTGERANGYVAAAPDFELYFAKDANYSLEFRVISDCDSVLLINTGSANWYWDDDDLGNLDAKIRLTRPSAGWYDIWIGTLEPGNCNAQLILETF